MIYPAILTDSIETLESQLDFVSSLVEVVQIDYIDANFAEEMTLTPSELESIDFRGLQADIHVMTNDPFNELKEIETIGSHVRAVIAQVERMPSQRAFIDEVKLGKWKVGLSLDLFTPIDAIDEDVWKDLDVVQLMAIEAGKQGQVFESAVLKKIFDIRAYLLEHNLSTELIIDGGINPSTLAQCKKAGADSFAVGSYLWKSDDISASLSSLQQAA